MNDNTALIRQTDGRHVQEKGVPVTQLSTGKPMFALQMNCDFTVETKLGTLTGQIGDYIIHDASNGGNQGIVNEPTFSLLYKVNL